jgi:hypothetical protein
MQQQFINFAVFLSPKFQYGKQLKQQIVNHDIKKGKQIRTDQCNV